MTITTTSLTRAAGLAAAAAGAIFIGVQINHPYLDSASIATTNVEIRDNLKVLMAVLALVGISGMYLSQTRRNGRVGLVGYAVLAAGYLSILCTSFVAAYVLPALAGVNPDYVDDVTAVATSRSADGDIGILHTVFQVQGFAYLAGGLIFGIALYRHASWHGGRRHCWPWAGWSRQRSPPCPTRSTASSPSPTASP